MLTGSKMADSTTTSVVASEISDAAPPMTPAMADGPSGSAMSSVSVVELAVDVVERLEPLALAGQADDEPAVADRGRIERVDRLAELEHHVVADVDDVADRALAGGDEPHLDDVGRRPDGHAADPAADEPRAQRRLLDLDAKVLADRRRRPRSGRSPGSGPARRSRPTTSRASPTRLSTSPRLGLTSTSRTTSPYRSASGHAERRVRRQDEDAVGVGGQAQLVARAQHPVADDAHLLGALDAPVAGQDGAGQGHRDALAGGDVRRPADDLERLAAARA